MSYNHPNNENIVMSGYEGDHSDQSEVVRYSSVGSYPLFYVSADNGAICPECVGDNIEQCCDVDDPQWYVAAHSANFEDPNLYCDHCSGRIESAYADDSEDN